LDVTAGITHHRTPKQTDFPQKANGVDLIAKQMHQEESVRPTIIPQHPTLERKFWDVLTPRQPFLLIRCNLKHMFHHSEKPKFAAKLTQTTNAICTA